ncbi:hypothetical protein Pmani_002507, partial [Petrolisthes manimaculis]
SPVFPKSYVCMSLIPEPCVSPKVTYVPLKEPHVSPLKEPHVSPPQRATCVPLEPHMSPSKSHVFPFASTRAFKGGMECVDAYTSSCLTPVEQHDLRGDLEGARSFLAFLCDDPVFQKGKSIPPDT